MPDYIVRLQKRRKSNRIVKEVSIHADSPGQAVYIVRHEQADIFDETWEAIGVKEKKP